MIENFELVKRGSKTYKLNTEFNYVAPVKFIHGKKTSEFYEQFCPEDNIVTITVTNNYESEEDIYEIRFNGYAKSYNHKWS